MFCMGIDPQPRSLIAAYGSYADQRGHEKAFDGICRSIQLERRYQYLAQGYDFDWLVGQVATILSLDQEIVTRRGRYPDTVEARSVLCYSMAVQPVAKNHRHDAKRLDLDDARQALQFENR